MAKLRLIIPDTGDGWAAYIGDDPLEGVTHVNVEVATGEQTFVVITLLSQYVDIYQSHDKPTGVSH